MKKTLFLSFAFVSALLGSVILNDQSVSAVSGPCYYGGGTCSAPGTYGDCGTNDVLPGRNTSCGGTPALNGVNTESEFINRIINLSDNGGRAQRGARFIMNETTGTTNTAQFRKILSQPDVTIKAENYSGSVTSWYDPGKNDFFYANYSGGYTRYSIVIRYKGTIYSVIEIACGNMTGKHTVVPEPKDSTITPKVALPDAGPYPDGKVVDVDAWVNKSGPDTWSNWTFRVWYENNGNDSYGASSTDNLIAEDSGGPTKYTAASNTIKDQQRTINNNNKRICVSLNLSAPKVNVDGGDTNITGDPDKVCRDIIQPVENDPTGSISVVCVNPATSQQRITYAFNDPDGVATGSISSTSGYSASNLSETSGTSVNYQPDTGGKTYTLTVTNPKAAGGFGTSKTFTATSQSNCVPTTTDNPPTGQITFTASCPVSSTQHSVTYWNLSDPNGGSPKGKVTTSPTNSSTNVVSGPATSGTFWKPHGVVTYYLWVENIDANGVATGNYGNAYVASTTTTNPLPCPASVEIDPDARLTDASGNILGGSTVNPGQQIKTLTRVYNNGNVSTTSNWTREFWYDNNGNSVYDSGEVRIVSQSTGGPTTYGPLVYTPVAGVATTPAGGVDGTKTRICVSLNLSNVATNPVTTIAPPNPQPDCKNIATLPNELTPEVSLSASILEPGQPLTATAAVSCDPGTTQSSSDYRRIFWYENGGNPSRYDSGIDTLVTPGPSDDSANKTYCAGSTPFATWGPRTVPTSGVTRACTSLQLTNPSANATIPGSGIAVDCADVATKYFFQALFGDVNAAACLYSGCTASDTTISAFSVGSPNYRGSGSQVAAFATGSIDEFTSGNNGSFEAPGNPKRLTFANNGGTYGGSFAQSAGYQIPNYWTGATTSANQTVGSSPANVITNGDAYITGNSPVGSVGIGNVSGLRWVVARNIYISGSLSTLDGVYIARNNIYTCASGFSPVPLSQMATQCTTPLTVRGALVAGDSVKLQRVRTNGGIGTGLPSEVIEYNPFVWIQGINAANPIPTTTSGKLDFITTLPPIL